VLGCVIWAVEPWQIPSAAMVCAFVNGKPEPCVSPPNDQPLYFAFDPYRLMTLGMIVSSHRDFGHVVIWNDPVALARLGASGRLSGSKSGAGDTDSDSWRPLLENVASHLKDLASIAEKLSNLLSFGDYRITLMFYVVSSPVCVFVTLLILLGQVRNSFCIYPFAELFLIPFFPLTVLGAPCSLPWWLAVLVPASCTGSRPAVSYCSGS
jgi:hypothetical protein